MKTNRHILSILFCFAILFPAPSARAACDLFEFGHPYVQYHIYSDGKTWDFNVTEDMTIGTVYAQSRLAGPGTYSLEIEILINGIPRAGWTVDDLTASFQNYNHSQTTNVDVNAGDTVTYKISGGTLGTEGGYITGPNYVSICGSEELPAKITGTIFHNDGSFPITDANTMGVFFTKDPDPCSPSATWSNGGGYGGKHTDGTYSLESLDDGTYYLEAFSYSASSNYIPEFWASPNSVRDCSNAQQIVISNGSIASDINFQLDPGALMTGTVYTGDNNSTLVGESNTRVDLYIDNPCDYNYVGGYWINSDDGTYTLWGIPPGTYYPLLHTEDTSIYDSIWWNSNQFTQSDECSNAQSVSVLGTDPIDNINFYLYETPDQSNFLLKTIPTILAAIQAKDTNSDDNTGNGACIEIPNASILIDGSFGDWNNIPIIITDSSGDGNKLIDFTSISIAQDSEYIYLHWEFANSIENRATYSHDIAFEIAPAPAAGYNLSAHFVSSADDARVAINLTSDNSSVKTYPSSYVKAGSKDIEYKVPKADIPITIPGRITQTWTYFGATKEDDWAESRSFCFD